MWLSAVQNFLLASLKGVAGIMTGSRALMADALHSGSDIACALLAIWGRKISGRPKDKRHPYGYGKIEFIVGVVVGSVLMFAASHIFFKSAKVLLTGAAIAPPQFTAFWVALLSVYSNFLISYVTMCAAKSLNSPALKSISVDNRSDAYSSVPVVICILGSQFGFPELDPIAAVFVGLIVFKMGAGLVIENYRGLLDVAVAPDKAKKIQSIITSSPGVKDISYLRTRQVGEKVWVDAEVCVEGEKTVDEAYMVSRDIRSALMRGLRDIGNVQISLKPAGG